MSAISNIEEFYPTGSYTSNFTYNVINICLLPDLKTRLSNLNLILAGLPYPVIIRRRLEKLITKNMDGSLWAIFLLPNVLLICEALRETCHQWQTSQLPWITDIHTKTFCIDSNRTDAVSIGCSQDTVMVFNSPCVYGAYASSVSGSQCDLRSEDCVVPFEDMERKAQGHEIYDISHYVQNKDKWKCNGKMLNVMQVQYTCVPITLFQDMCNATFQDKNRLFLWKSDAAIECQCKFTINAGTQGLLELLYLKTLDPIFRVSVDGSVLNKTHITPVPWIKPHMESSVIEADYGVQALVRLIANDPLSGSCSRKGSAVLDSPPPPSTTIGAVPNLGTIQSQVSLATQLGISSVASISILCVILFIIGAVLAKKRCRPARRDPHLEAGLDSGSQGQQLPNEDRHYEYIHLGPLPPVPHHPPPRPRRSLPPELPLIGFHEGSTHYSLPSGSQPYQQLQSRNSSSSSASADQDDGTTTPNLQPSQFSEHVTFGPPRPSLAGRKTSKGTFRSRFRSQRDRNRKTDSRKPRDESTLNASGDPTYVEPPKPTRSKLRRRTKRKGYRHSRADTSKPSSNHSDSDGRGNSTDAVENWPRGAVSGIRNSLIGTKHGTMHQVYKPYNHDDDYKVRRRRSRPSRIAEKFSLMIKRVSSDEDKEKSTSTRKKKNASLMKKIKF